MNNELALAFANSLNQRYYQLEKDQIEFLKKYGGASVPYDPDDVNGTNLEINTYSGHDVTVTGYYINKEGRIVVKCIGPLGNPTELESWEFDRIPLYNMIINSISETLTPPEKED